MVEREQGAAGKADDECDEVVAHPAGSEPGATRGAGTASKPVRLAPRPDKGLPFAEALDDAMREHRAVFAALAK